MANKLELGIIGVSEGNGHPYSWSAIINGYDKAFMESCPYPAIPEYLNKRSQSAESFMDANVTHIWTQDLNISKKISDATYIPNICTEPNEMIGEVDAVLLARDDAENHLEISLPFLNEGLPIFIDKPLAYDVATAEEIFRKQQYNDQIFTCSSLVFAKEFHLTPKQKHSLGEIIHIDASIHKSWKKYSVHIIEPSIMMLGQYYELNSICSRKHNDISLVSVEWKSGPSATFRTLGNNPSQVSIRLYGTKGHTDLIFLDTYTAFKASLEHFVNLIQLKASNIDRKQTLQTIEIIEKGSK